MTTGACFLLGSGLKSKSKCHWYVLAFVMIPIVYLVSGASRGIGLALVTNLAHRDNVIVFAGARDPPRASDLHELQKQFPDKFYIVKLTAADKTDNTAAIEEIQSKAGRLDVVIANTGICNNLNLGADTPADSMHEHYDVNAIGTLVLFQAAWPLLRESTTAPKFVGISSVVGSIGYGTTLPIQLMAYGASKAALNFVLRKLRYENEGLIIFPICPGFVTTGTSDFVRTSDPEVATWQFKTPAESAIKVLEVIDYATRQTDAFMNWDGTEYPW